MLPKSRLFPLFIILLVAGPGCASLPGMPRPEVRVVDAKIDEIDFEGVVLAFDVAVSNPYPVKIQAAKFRYGLEIEGADFVDSAASFRTHIPAGGASTIRLPVRLSYFDLLRDYPHLRGALQVPYRLRAAIRISVMGSSLEIPFSREGLVPILQPPNVIAAKVRLTDISLSEAKLVVDADIENPNAFGLDIRDLDYELVLGDICVEVHGGSLDGTTIGAGQSKRATLSGGITPSEGLINLLMNGLSDLPNVSAYGRIGTPYGTVSIPR